MDDCRTVDFNTTAAVAAVGWLTWEKTSFTLKAVYSGSQDTSVKLTFETTYDNATKLHHIGETVGREVVSGRPFYPFTADHTAEERDG